MNAYDFDETIYKGDSTRDFFFYCIRRNPALLRYLPLQGWHFLKWKGFRLYTKTQFKEQFYRFFRGIDNIDAYVADFWKGHLCNVKGWYKAQHNEDDLIISASPEFLLRPACDALGITHLIASRVDKRTGAYDGENCYGEEKVKRLNAEMPDAVIDAFYSDSLSDTPMALLTPHRYIVLDDTIIDWDTYKK